MKKVTVSKARNNFDKLLDEVVQSDEPICIAGKKNKAVLLSEENWRAIQETLYLVSLPGMRKSILKGMKTPVDKCSDKLTW